MGVRLVSEWKGSLQLVYVLFGAEVARHGISIVSNLYSSFFLSLNINYRCSFVSPHLVVITRRRFG